MNKKRGFTLIEMMIVVFVIAMLVLAWKNYLNNEKQERLIFWETCINSIFWELQKFKADVDYGNTVNLALSGGGDASYYFLDMHQEITTWVQFPLEGWEIYLWWGQVTDTWMPINVTRYKKLSTQVTQCINKQYAVTMTTGSAPFDVLMPTTSLSPSKAYKITYTHSDGSLIPPARTAYNSLWWETLLSGSNSITQPSYVEKTFKVCNHIYPATWDLIRDPKICLEIARFAIDRRTGQFHYWKCQKTNTTWTCSLRPTKN